MSQQGKAPGSVEPLNVIIVGAGIAGLTLAIVLRQNGHRVRLYEQSQFGRELGAAVHMAPNAHGLFKKLGIDLAGTGANEVEYVREYAPSAKLNREIPIGQINKIWQHKWMLAHRVRIHDALKEKALAPDGPGQPCELHLSNSVASVDPETATITLKDGTSITGDVVVGADGVHSKSRSNIPGGETHRPFGSGKSGFRFMISREEALNDPVTRPLCEKTGVFSVVIGSDRRIVMYPTSNNTLLNFLAIHPDSESQAGEDWNSETSKTSLLNVYRDFAPEFQAILAKADPESLKLWKLLDMENLPSWYVSRFALIGDAAHPFLPHQGQGAAIAMEDAVALGTVLERGLGSAEVPDRLKLYNEIRYERACKVQEYTRLAGLDVQDGKLDTVEYARYNFGHDEFDNSAQKLREWKWKRVPEIAFRSPAAFGPDQSLYLSARRPTQKPAFQTTSISFKTSRTLIKNLFPPGVANFSFDGPGTLAACSFVHTVYKHVTWLQDGSYGLLGLYIHDVTHRGADGEMSHGSYVPILLENSPYTVSRDREIYGLPVLYSDIISELLPGSCSVTASSGGQNWVTLSLDDLRPSTETLTTSSAVLGHNNATNSGLLSWTSVPRFGSGNKETGMDAFAVRVSFEDEDKTFEVEQIYESSTASVHFPPRNPDKADVLENIIERLAEIPIYEVLGARVILGNGTPGFKRANRI